MNSPGNKAAKRARNAAALCAKNARTAAAPRSPTLVFPPSFVVAKSNTRPIALILGGADCLKADMDAALALFTPTVIIATNNAGFDYPGPLDHWATMHPEKMPEWVKRRRKNGYPDAGTLWHPRIRTPPNGLDMRDCPHFNGGGSGLFAISVCIRALQMRGVLAGVPMQVERAHYDDPKPWTDGANYLKSWRSHLREYEGRIKSMSGWTRELLGGPDQGWLK